MPLTNMICKSVKPGLKPCKLADGNGLYLEVSPSGSKYWRLKYRFAGKEKRLALGVYPEVSLKEVRDKRDQARKLLADGIDPSQAKKEAKVQQLVNLEHSFENIACEWYENQKHRWTTKYSTTAMNRLKADVFPFLGARTISEITPPELLLVLRTIESRGAIDVTHRVHQLCGQIFRYAIATGRAKHDISLDLRGALKTRKKENHARLEAKELPEFLWKLEHYDGDLQTKLALKFLLLTFVRTGELRGAAWDEIDFEKMEWRIPATRMKMRDPHIVPLTGQAIDVLKQLKGLNNNRDHVFPNRNRPSTFISENTMLYAIYRMGYHSRATTHGFRATASTILNEHGFNSDVIERQLAHAERSSVRAAYNHAQFLPQRREMMQWWADYLDEARGAV